MLSIVLNMYTLMQVLCMCTHSHTHTHNLILFSPNIYEVGTTIITKMRKLRPGSLSLWSNLCEGSEVQIQVVPEPTYSTLGRKLQMNCSVSTNYPLHCCITSSLKYWERRQKKKKENRENDSWCFRMNDHLQKIPGRRDIHHLKIHFQEPWFMFVKVPLLWSSVFSTEMSLLDQMSSFLLWL